MRFHYLFAQKKNIYARILVSYQLPPFSGEVIETYQERSGGWTVGRGLESNWTASFDLPVLRVASVKNPDVAELIGANLGDGVVRFDMPAPSTIGHHD